MARPPSLLETLQGIIERTYRMRTGIRDVGLFVLGDDGYRRLYGSAAVCEKVALPVGAGGDARLLLRLDSRSGALRAAIYYPDAMVRRLEERSPARGLDDGNIDDFAVLVEELDHLLCVASRVGEGRAFSLLELELHANVTKYLAGALFLALSRSGAEGGAGRRPPSAGRGPASGLTEGERAWLRYHLFEKLEFADEDPEVRARYRHAARLGWRFLAGLEALHPSGRLAALRAFHRRSHEEKLAMLGGGVPEPRELA